MSGIFIGMGTCGLATGAGKVKTAVEKWAQAHSVKLPITPTGCIGYCQVEPIMDVVTDDAPDVFAANLAAFMARAEAWRERRRGKEVARYDLRPLVLELHYDGPGVLGQAFSVMMRAASNATGRPDELLAELGLAEAERRIVRTQLMFG